MTPAPFKFASLSLFGCNFFASISLGANVIPRRNWKQWLCNFFFLGGPNKVLYGLCENGEQTLFTTPTIFGRALGERG